MISKNFCVEQVRSEQFRRALCGNSARRDLYGGGWVTGRPTVIIIDPNYFSGVIVEAQRRAHSRLCNQVATLEVDKKISKMGGLFVVSCLSKQYYSLSLCLVIRDHAGQSMSLWFGVKKARTKQAFYKV